jgi:ABC-type Na+ efflux pump permease subunit
MVWLPVVERELRVAARKRSTYWVRLLALLAVTLVMGWAVFFSATMKATSGPAAGHYLFGVLAIPVGIFSLLTGVFATSDCIGVEKREGTLGLLFLTDLKGYDVVFGKLAANSMNALYALIAVLPAFGVPLLMGGVTPGQFLGEVLALMTASAFSLSAGIFVSTYQRSERKAMFMTFAFLLFFTFLPVVADYYDPAGLVLGILSPVNPIIMAAVVGTVLNHPKYWYMLAALWLIIILLLGRASKRVGLLQENVMPATTRTAPRRMALRPKRQAMTENPFTWLAARSEGDARLVWLFLACMLVIWLVLLVTRPGGLKLSDLLSGDAVQASDMVLHTVLKIWIISEASRRLAEDQRTGAFELLLTTPLSAKQLIRGQWQALWRQFSKPIMAILVWDFLIGAGMERHTDNNYGYEHWLAALFLVADGVALTFAGMWLALRTGNRNRSILGGLLLVLTLPWIVSWAANRSVDLAGGYVQWIEFAVWGLADEVVIIWAASRIKDHFRRVATEGWTGKVKL